MHIDSVKDETADLHLLTRSHFLHFLRLCPAEESVNGMYYRFIMTTQSIHYITAININRSSSQQTQEEFIFSIATVNIIIILFLKNVCTLYLLT